MAVKTQQRQVACDEGTITYFLTRKPVRNVNLRIKPDGRVLVSANNHVPVRLIDEFVQQKQAFILSALARFEEKRSQEADMPAHYESGECFRILGRKLRLEVEESVHEGVELGGCHNPAGQGQGGFPAQGAAGGKVAESVSENRI